MVAKIRAEGLDRSKAVDTFTYLTTNIGPRLTNSPAHRRSIEWTQERLRAYGLANVHTDPFEFGRGWELERLSIEMIEPRYLPLIGFPRGWSPSTPGKIVASPVWLPNPTPESVAAAGASLKGAILMASPPQTYFIRADRPPASGDLVNPPRATPPLTREQQAEAAAKLRAANVGVVLAPNIGEHGTIFVTGRDEGPNAVPSVVLASEHYNLIARLIEQKIPVKLAVDLQTRFYEQDRTHRECDRGDPGHRSGDRQRGGDDRRPSRLVALRRGRHRQRRWRHDGDGGLQDSPGAGREAAADDPARVVGGRRAGPARVARLCAETPRRRGEQGRARQVLRLLQLRQRDRADHRLLPRRQRTDGPHHGRVAEAAGRSRRHDRDARRASAPPIICPSRRSACRGSRRCRITATTTSGRITPTWTRTNAFPRTRSSRPRSSRRRCSITPRCASRRCRDDVAATLDHVTLSTLGIVLTTAVAAQGAQDLQGAPLERADRHRDAGDDRGQRVGDGVPQRQQADDHRHVQGPEIAGHRGPAASRAIAGCAARPLPISKCPVAPAARSSGSVELTKDQVGELAKSLFYVQLHSEKAPEGNLWGWLLPVEGKTK